MFWCFVFVFCLFVCVGVLCFVFVFGVLVFCQVTLRGYLRVLVTRVALEGLHTDNIAPSPTSACFHCFQCLCKVLHPHF